MFDEKKFFPPHCGADGTFPPEKPQFSGLENLEHTKRELHNMVDRLRRFEENMNAQFNDMLKHLTGDNTTFKNTFSESHRLFIEEVKNEINRFENNVDNSITLFTSTLGGKYDEYETNTKAHFDRIASELNEQFTATVETLNTRVDELESTYASDLSTFKTSTQEQYESFMTQANTRMDAHNTNMGNALNDYKQKVTTEINNFMATVNSRHNVFTNSITETNTLFRETVESILNERLNSQDGKISDAEMWMKTNLVGTVQQELGDMAVDGRLKDIIETEVFHEFSNKVSHYVTPEMFGAICGTLGEGDNVEYPDTQALQTAVNSASVVVLSPKKYYINDVIMLPSNITIYGNGATIISPSVEEARNCFEGYDITTGEGRENIRIYDLNVEFEYTAPCDQTISYPVDENTGTWSNIGFLHLKECSNITLENVNVKNGRYFIWGQNNTNITVNKCTYRGQNLACIYLGGEWEKATTPVNYVGTGSYNIHITNSTFEISDLGGLHQHHIYTHINTHDMYIDNCTFIGGNGPAIKFGDDNTRYADPYNMFVSNSYFINVFGAVYVSGDGQCEIKNVFVDTDKTYSLFRPDAGKMHVDGFTVYAPNAILAHLTGESHVTLLNGSADVNKVMSIASAENASCVARSCDFVTDFTRYGDDVNTKVAVYIAGRGTDKRYITEFTNCAFTFDNFDQNMPISVGSNTANNILFARCIFKGLITRALVNSTGAPVNFIDNITYNVPKIEFTECGGVLSNNTNITV